MLKHIELIIQIILVNITNTIHHHQFKVCDLDRCSPTLFNQIEDHALEFWCICSLCSTEHRAEEDQEAVMDNSQHLLRTPCVPGSALSFPWVASLPVCNIAPRNRTILMSILQIKEQRGKVSFPRFA